MKKCATCKHWYNPKKGWAECLQLLDAWESISIDVSGPLKGIYTKEDFGCAHHKEFREVADK